MPVDDSAASTTAEETELTASESEETESAATDDQQADSSPAESVYSESETEEESEEDESVSASEAAKGPEGPSKAERRIKQLTAQIHNLQGQLAQRPMQPMGPPTRPTEPTEPNPEMFTDIETFKAAMKKWNEDSKTFAIEKARQEKEQRDRAEAQAKLEVQLQAKWNKNAERVKKDDPEFDLNKILPLIQPNATTMGFFAYSDYGPEIAHYLDENPDESDRIRSLDPYATAREMWALHEKFSNQVKGIKPKQSAGKVSGKVAGKQSGPPPPKDIADYFYK